MSDLAALPAVSFCDTDATLVEQSVITTYETITETSLAAGDPVRLLLESLAYTIAVQRQVIDLTGKKNLLAYADGDFLDHLGALTDTPRLAAGVARTTVRFSLGEVQAAAVNIPAGTRVTPDNKLMFVADVAAEIPAGELSVNVSAICETSGTVGNGFLAGQVSRLVDPISGVTSVVNLSTTLGGTDVESDDRYRARVQLSPEKASTAGPAGKYRYWAESAHQDIADVSVLSPNPGVVDVVVLMKDGALPSDEVLQLVDAAVSAETVRPLTDTVQVLAPEQVPYTIDLTYYIGRSNISFVSQIQQSVAAAVSDFEQWQRAALGRDINPTELIHRIRQAGAKRVEVSTPAHTPLTGRQVAVCSSSTVTYGGLEND